MRGHLLNGVTVALHPDTALLGGSWIRTQSNGDLWVSDRELIALARDYLGRFQNPVLWDVGASTGSFLMLAAIMPTLRVAALEPNPEVFDVLACNVLANHIGERVELHRIAAAEHTGTLSFWVCGKGSNTGEGRCMPVAGWPSQQVPAAALDELDLPAPTLIKMDIEGMELFALRGAAQTIEAHKPALILECSTELCPKYGYTVDDVTDLLTEWSYHHIWPTNGNLYAWVNQ